MDKIEKQILAGELPEEFQEKFEIVPQAHPLARQFSEMASRVVKRLLGDAYDPALHNFRFLLSAQEQPNAFVISMATPPVMAFSTGLLNRLPTEDHFAAVVAHELTHKRLQQRLGEHANAKLEELGSDAFGVLSLQDAGYRPRAMAEMLALQPDNNQRSFFTYMDAHPNTPLRVRTAENVVDGLVKSKGTENTQPTELVEPVWQEMKTFNQPRYMQRVLAAKGFETADNLRKIEIIRDVVDHEDVNPEDPYRSQRFDDFKEAISTMILDRTNPVESAAFNDLANYLIERKDETPVGWLPKAPALYDCLASIYKQSPAPADEPDAPAPPLYEAFYTAPPSVPGYVGQLSLSMQRFIAAADKEEATREAQNIVMLYEKINHDFGERTSRHYQGISHYLSSFRLPTQADIQSLEKRNEETGGTETLPFPWHRHTSWAKESKESHQAPHLQLALAMMGVGEEHGNAPLGQMQPKLSYKKWGKDWTYFSFPNPIVKPVWGYELSKLSLTPDLQIQGFRQAERFWPALDADVTPELVARFNASETKWLAQKDQEGRLAAQAVDWTVWDRPNFLRDYDRIRAETGFEEGSYDLSSALEKLDWYRDSPFPRRHLTSDAPIMRATIEEYEYEKMNSRTRDVMFDNKEHLAPQISIKDGGDAFQKALAEKWGALVASDPETYAPMVRQFFNGKFGGYIKDLPKVSAILGLPNLISDAASIARADDVTLMERKMLNLPLGVSPKHPYMSLVTQAEVGLPPSERLYFLALTRYLDDDKTLDPKNRWAFDPVNALGLPPIEKTEDFGAFYQLAKEHISDFEAPDRWGTRHEAFFISDLLASEAHNLLSNPDKELRRDELVALERVSRLGFLSDMISSTRVKLDEALIRTAQKEIVPTTTNDDLIESYTQYAHFGLFLNQPSVRHQYEAEIQKRIESITDKDVKRRLAERILLSRPIKPALLTKVPESNYECSLTDPDFRKLITETYVDNLVAAYGKDDGGPAFATSAKLLIDDILKRTSGGIRFAILSRLADKMEMQRELSYHIRDQIVEKQIAGLDQYDRKFAFGEMSIDTINRNNDTRLGTIDFIKTPLTRDNAARYVALLKEKGDVSSLFAPEERKLAQALKGQQSFYNPEIEIEAAIQAHRNFWAMPLELRIFIADKIEFPVEDKTAHSFAANKKRILDTYFPLPAKAASPRKTFLRTLFSWSKKALPSRAVITRDFVEAYLSSAKESEQRLFLSALLVANEPTDSSVAAKRTISGKAIKQILYAHGPAGYKTSQSLEGFSQTPEDIRRELKESKFNAGTTYRWTVHEMLDQNGLSDQLVHVGPVLGAGSYGITVETHKRNRPPTATTMLRDNVRPRAQREFGVFMKTCNKLIEKYPSFKPLKAMIKQAMEMSRVETDMDLAARQVRFARRLYNVGVTVDGHKFHFGTAPWVSHGKDYKETQIVSGEHFLSLPVKTAKQRAYKKAVAKAVLLVELRILMAGRPFDHDRHGGQQKIKGDQIGLFDHGAMALKAPNDKQKLLLGRVIGAALRQHVYSRRRTSVAQALVNQIDRFSEKQEDAQFMTEVKRAFLALSDYTKALDNAEIASVVALAWSSPDVHPLIQKGMKKGLGVLSPVVLGVLKQKAQKASITLKTNDTHIPLESASTSKQERQSVQPSPAQQRRPAPEKAATPNGRQARHYKALQKEHVDHARLSQTGPLHLGPLSMHTLKNVAQEELKKVLSAPPKSTAPAQRPTVLSKLVRQDLGRH